MPLSGNFEFLNEHELILLQLAASVERVLASDPNTTIIKLRQWAEAMAQNLTSV